MSTFKRKYKNIKTKGYDSKKEYSRSVELKMLANKNEITNLREQVTFELLPSQKVNGKIIERPVKYIADFVYDCDGITYVEDCKGVKTKDYVIKRKLMLYIHNIQIKET